MATNIDKTVTISTQWKDDGLGNMARTIKTVGNGFDTLRTQVKNANGNITSTVQKTTTQLRGLEKAAASVKSSIGGLFTKLLAFEAVKKVLTGVADAFKQFDKAAGTNVTKNLADQWGQIQVNIGATIYPLMKFLTETNALKNIGTVLRAISGAFASLALQIEGAFYGIQWVIVKVFDGVISYVEGVVSKLKNMLFDLVASGGKLGEFAKPLLVGVINLDNSLIKMNASSSESLSGLEKNLGKVGDALLSTAKAAIQGTDVKYISEAVKKEVEKIKQELAKIDSEYITAFDKIGESYDNFNLKISEESNDFTESFKQAEYATAKSLDNIKRNMYEARDAMRKKENNPNETYSTTIISDPSISGEIRDKIANQVDEYIQKGIAIEEINRLIKEEHNITIDEIVTFDKAISKIDELSATYKKYYDIKLQIAGKEAGKNEIDKMIDTQTQLRDIAIESTKDRVEQVKLISMASYNEQEEALRASLDQSLITYEQYNTAAGMLEDQRVQKVIAAEKEIEQARIDSIIKQIESYAGMANSVISIADKMKEVRLNNIDKEDKSQRDLIESTVKGEKTKAKALAALDKQTEEKKKAENEKFKAWSIAQALISGALAAIQAYQSMLSIPVYGVALGAVAAALVAGVTAAQVAVIESQTFASGGFVKGQGSKDSQHAMVSPGEAILNTEQQRRFMALANGNSSPTNSNITLSDTIIVNGNLDMAAANQIRVDREAQLTQLREQMRELKYRGQLVAA